MDSEIYCEGKKIKITLLRILRCERNRGGKTLDLLNSIDKELTVSRAVN